MWTQSTWLTAGSAQNLSNSTRFQNAMKCFANSRRNMKSAENISFCRICHNPGWPLLGFLEFSVSISELQLPFEWFSANNPRKFVPRCKVILSKVLVLEERLQMSCGLLDPRRSYSTWVFTDNLFGVRLWEIAEELLREKPVVKRHVWVCIPLRHLWWPNLMHNLVFCLTIESSGLN